MFISKIIVIFLTLTLLAAASSAVAAPELTLKEAISTALKKNPELQVFAAEIAAAQGDVKTARTWENPELDMGSGSQITRENGRRDAVFHSTLELGQTFKFPGKRALEVALAQGNLELQKVALAGLRFQLEIRVREAFFRMLAFQQMVSLRQQQIESAQVFIAHAQKRAEIGYGSDFEAVKGEADLIAAREELQRTEGEIAAARATLNTLLAGDPGAPLVIVGSLESLTLSPEARDYVALALARNPSLQAQMKQAELAGINLRAVKLSRNPDFKIGASLEYTDAQQIAGVGISLPLPLWDRKQGEVEKATAWQRKTRAEIQTARARLAGEVVASAARWQSAIKAAQLYPPDYLRKLKAFLTQTEESYAQRATPLLIYLDAKRTYFESLRSYYESLTTIAESRAALESAVGVPLDLNP
jgi:cobalt-zinc-cadmium efflux system outer membrane protein